MVGNKDSIKSGAKGKHKQYKQYVIMLFCVHVFAILYVMISSDKF